MGSHRRARRGAAATQFIVQVVIFWVCFVLHAPVWLYLLAMVLDYYARIPSSMLERLSFPIAVKYAPFDFRQHADGVKIEEFIATQTAALEREGFRRVGGPVQRLGSETRPTGCVYVLRDSAGGIAQVSVTYLKTEAANILRPTCFFHTRFADGSRRSTSNMDTGVYPRNPQVRGSSLPMVRDASQLARIHRALVAGDGTRTIAPFPDAPPEELLETEYAESYARQIRNGYFRRDETKGTYVPTILGAALMGWKLAPPFVHLRRWLRRREARRIIAALGVTEVAKGDSQVLKPTGPALGLRLLGTLTFDGLLYWAVQTSVQRKH